MENTFLYKKVWHFANTHQMFDSNSYVLIALSGGPDSVALVSLLMEIQKNIFPTLKLCLAHLNHLLRDEESQRDEIFVCSFAEKLGLPIVIKQIPVKEFSIGENLEATARKLRYAFLLETAKEIGATSVATAHNLNDQAETFLMRLIRGAGIRGLGAMKPVTNLSISTELSAKVIRPLLNTNRKDIETYIKEKELNTCIDSSNFSTKFTRNKIRLEILPKILEINPKAIENIARATVLLTEWEESLAENLSPIASNKEGEVKISVSELLALAPILRHQKIRNTIEQIQGKLQRLSSKHIFSIDRLLAEGKSGKKIVLPGNLEVLREFDKIVIQPKSDFKVTKKENFITLSLGETLENTIFNIIYREATLAELSSYDKNSYILLDLDKVGEKLKVRNRWPGDSYQPLGHKKQEKLKKLMLEKRIAFSQRDIWPIITTLENEIIWVPKLPVATNFAANSKTRRFAIIIAK